MMTCNILSSTCPEYQTYTSRLCSAPERRHIAEKLQMKPKALGDERHVPTSQDMGTLILADDVEDIHVFKQLAREYVIEGSDRTAVCSQNAQVCLCVPKYPLPN